MDELELDDLWLERSELEAPILSSEWRRCMFKV